MSHRRFTRQFLTTLLLVAVCAACAALPACQLLSLFAGHGTQKPLYTIPKNAHVLVLVDSRPSVTVPPGYDTMQANKISSHLYQYKAADFMVPQDRLVELKRDQAAFTKMGVADIARECGADVVVVLDIWTFSTESTLDKTVSQGSIQALVKVVAKDGTRLYPVGSPGVPVEAHIDPAFTSDRDLEGALTQLSDLVAVHTGRLFHEYDLGDRDMTK